MKHTLSVYKYPMYLVHTLQSYQNLKAKPIFDLYTKKLISVIDKGNKSSTNQALVLAEDLGEGYCTALVQHFSPLDKDLTPAFMDWDYMNRTGDFMSYLEFLDNLVKEYKVGVENTFLLNGKPVPTYKVEKAFLEYCRINFEGDYKYNVMKDITLRYTIDFDGHILSNNEKQDITYVIDSVCGPRLTDNGTIRFGSVDSIDIGLALDYTDTVVDENNLVQRGVLFIDVTIPKSDILDTDSNGVGDYIGELSFVDPNGMAVPLEEEAGVVLHWELGDISSHF